MYIVAIKLDYSIVCIEIISPKQVGDNSGRADTGIWHGIFRKYIFFSPPLNGQIYSAVLIFDLEWHLSSRLV